MLVSIAILLTVLAVVIAVYYIYEPFLDIVECGGSRWLVIWYTDKKLNTREYKKLFRLGNG